METEATAAGNVVDVAPCTGAGTMDAEITTSVVASGTEIVVVIKPVSCPIVKAWGQFPELARSWPIGLDLWT